ncbi:MAG: glycosyl hydrolase family 28-related protein [Pirellulaceae bacterium]
MQCVRSALVSLTIGAMTVAVGATELPHGDPPQPASRRINVADFGAHLSDDDHDDTPAVNAAIKAVTNDSTLYFPAGVYNLRWLDKIRGFDSLSIQGDGRGESILKRMGPYWKAGDAHTWDNLVATYGTDAKLLQIEDCRNMCIRDIGLDAHGTPTFGGVSIVRPRRLHIVNTRYFDSQEQPPLFGCDRYAWVVVGYEQGSEDVWFVNNRVEGLQTELDSVRRVLVERNVFERSVKSPGLGFLSGNFSEMNEFAPGYHTIDVTVRQNYFTNSVDLSMGLVTFQLDPSSNCNSRFQDIDIVDNVFVYNIDSSAGHCAIKLGAADSSRKTTGNVFERFRIEGNRIYRSPQAEITEPFAAYIWFNTWEGEERLNHTSVRGNRLFSDTGTKPLTLFLRGNESVGLVVEDNTSHPYQEPPTIEEFMRRL